MAELRLVKPRVESSNLSSSACGGRSPQSEYDEEGESWRSVPPLAGLLTPGESPVGRGSCLENSKLLKVRGFDSLSLRTVIAIRR